MSLLHKDRICQLKSMRRSFLHIGRNVE